MNAVGHNRVLVALAHDLPSETIFEPVFKIAGRKRIPVECVCIEDTRLFDIAGLPQSQVIHAYSHEASPLDEPTVRRALRVTSMRTRERFEATITRTELAWNFRTRQATALSEAFSDAAPDDLIVVPLLRGARNADQVRGLIDAVSHDITASLLVLNEAGNPDTSVLAVFDGDRDDLAAAVELARDFRCPLTVFAVGKTADVAQRRADEVQAYLEESGQASTVEIVISRDTADMTASIIAAAPGTLVLDRAGEAASALNIVSLLAETKSSLLLRN